MYLLVYLLCADVCVYCVTSFDFGCYGAALFVLAAWLDVCVLISLLLIYLRVLFGLFCLFSCFVFYLDID